jgi:hypothetical protein
LELFLFFSGGGKFLLHRFRVDSSVHRHVRLEVGPAQEVKVVLRSLQIFLQTVACWQKFGDTEVLLSNVIGKENGTNLKGGIQVSHCFERREMRFSGTTRTNKGMNMGVAMEAFFKPRRPSTERTRNTGMRDKTPIADGE